MSWLAVLLALIAAPGLIAVALRLRRTARERDRLRLRLDDLDRQLADARLVNARFLGSVTHELRTPLAAILGYQELLAEGAYGDIGTGCREPVARIGAAAAELLALIDGVLELARLDTGRLELRLAPVDADPAVRDAVDRARTLALNRGVDLRSENEAPLPRITTDPDRLARTLDLALTAAIHASGAGGAVEVRSRRLEPDGILLDVRGSGNPIPVVGAPPPTAARHTALDGGVARPDAATTAGEAGVHLGLASRFASALGGDLAVLAADHGLAFRLSIRNSGPVPAPAESRRHASP